MDLKSKLKSDFGLIFLTYLTGYNISLINKIISEYGNISIAEFQDTRKDGPGNQYLSSTNFSSAFDEAFLCIDKLNYFKIKTESIFSKNYPARLKAIIDPPPILYYRGSVLKKNKLVAIVGTRDSTSIAEKVIKHLAEIFCRHDYGIVSGLALGIDSIAHKATLVEKGYTVAIMAGALNDIYPKQNFGLANEILKSGGTLISEVPFGISHGKKSFVMRNRIQAGISDFVMPIEMGIKSGTMTTVEFAYSQGKYIFLVPPAPSNKNLPQYEGINYFIEKSSLEKYKKTYQIKDLTELELFLTEDRFSKQVSLFDE